MVGSFRYRKYLSLAGSAPTQWNCYTRDRLIHIGQAKTGSLTWVMKQVNVISSLKRCRGTAFGDGWLMDHFEKVCAVTSGEFAEGT